MRKLLWIGILSVLVVGVTVFALWKGPHTFDRAECLDCHAQDPEKGDPKKLRAPESFLCMRCHDDLKATVSHPVDIEPRKVKIPPDMPLAEDGTITCSTCHDIHGPYKDPFGEVTHFLRRQVTGVRFCISCHSAQNILEGKIGHTMALERVHYKPKYYVFDGAMSVDPVSAECLSCHDGSIGSRSDVGVGYWRHSVDFFSQDRGVHPIGVNYRRAAMKDRKLRPPEALPSEIRLVDGKVSCISCHDPYSSRPMRLSMDNRGSRLCGGCHLLL